MDLVIEKDIKIGTLVKLIGFDNKVHTGVVEKVVYNDSGEQVCHVQYDGRIHVINSKYVRLA